MRRDRGAISLNSSNIRLSPDSFRGLAGELSETLRRLISVRLPLHARPRHEGRGKVFILCI
jgi:hypothetical protein